MPGTDLRIAVVGPCASGKTTLARALRDRGFTVIEPAQEHSGVPGLYRRSRPDVVIFLDASWEALSARRAEPPAVIRAQRERLTGAREGCDIYIDTDELSEEEVLRQALDRLRAGAASAIRTAGTPT